MGLKFNSKAAMSEFKTIFTIELEDALQAWEREVESKMTHSFYKKHANITHNIKKGVKVTTATLNANAAVLAESYGTGSYMLDNNPFLADYKNSDAWNPLRTGKAIVGRKQGTYTNIITGKPIKTSGKFAGVNIEGRRVFENPTDGNDYYISPTKPSFALQLAEQYLYKQWIPRAIDNAINRMDFSKFLIETKGR